MKSFLWKLMLLVPVLFVAAALFIWSGLFPIAASSGHWPVTAWLLHYAMQQSVATYSSGIEAPPLVDPALIRQGAGHYETGCAPCHGAPGREASAVLQHMTPQPPDLMKTVPDYEPEELFWIIKHGVKYTAMPAWPAQIRDDEVWAMTAFVERLPGMSNETYRRLALGPLAGRTDAADLADLGDPQDEVLSNCIRCHGRDGVGDPNGAFPRLDIQSEDYLYAALFSFAVRERESGMMEAAVSGLEPQTLRRLAAHYGKMQVGSLPVTAARHAPELVAAGARIAREGVPKENVPACAACHGPADKPIKDLYPALAGQYSRYIANQLEMFKKESPRGGTRFARLMDSFSHFLSKQQIAAVSAYYASLEPRRTSLSAR